MKSARCAHGVIARWGELSSDLDDAPSRCWICRNSYVHKDVERAVKEDPSGWTHYGILRILQRKRLWRF